MRDVEKLEKLAKLVRYHILKITTKAGSGHMTSSLSATDLMVALYFGKLRFDLKNPQNPRNDRVIFSKGHASPLFYSLYKVAGAISEAELETYRQFKSVLEGHPTPDFKYCEAATGSLGQGLSIGLGMAMASKLDGISNTTYVLLGDSELAEGSCWEAMELASFNKVDNLVGILDVNRLGQSGETMLGWDLEKYKQRIEEFGWETYIVDGHNIEEILDIFERLSLGNGKPKMIVAKTIKGKGVPFLENKEGWHAKVLDEEQLKEALFAFGDVDLKMEGKIAEPEGKVEFKSLELNKNDQAIHVGYEVGKLESTRKAYGEALAKLGSINSEIVSLDGEVKNSTFAEIFKEKHPDRYFEMFIAEQNMVGVAVGMARQGKIPYVSTFSAFMTRAHDQIRMAAYSQANIKFVGSHSGVSIGADGPSQMGLEDICLFRSVLDSSVLVPCDATSVAKLTEASVDQDGVVYVRTIRPETPVIYEASEKFEIGGSKILRQSAKDRVTIVACGITVHEALDAAEKLAIKDINIRVVDTYSIKPVDKKTLIKCAKETNGFVITVEDHYFEGGLGDAVLEIFAQDDKVKVFKMAVGKMPISGNSEELLRYEEIDSVAISKKVLEII